MQDSWVIKAIEKEAMVRARLELIGQPSTFRFMGFDPEQLAAITVHAMQKECSPALTVDEIKEKLNARYR